MGNARSLQRAIAGNPHIVLSIGEYLEAEFMHKEKQCLQKFSSTYKCTILCWLLEISKRSEYMPIPGYIW